MMGEVEKEWWEKRGWYALGPPELAGKREAGFCHAECGEPLKVGDPYRYIMAIEEACHAGCYTDAMRADDEDWYEGQCRAFG